LKMNMKRLALAVIGGVAITLLTALINHSPACTRIACMVGEVYNGYPLAWLEMLAGASWFVRPVRLVVDVVAWTIGAWIVIFGVSKVRNKYGIGSQGSSGKTNYQP